MEYPIQDKEAPDRAKTKILGPTFEGGKPEGEGPGKWRHKLTERKEILKYLEEGERYWFGKEWYGSEKRKVPA